MNEYTLSPKCCAIRRRRLLDVMSELSLDLVLVNSIENIQWLTGVRFPPFFTPLAALYADGELIVVKPSSYQEDIFADKIFEYPAKELSTIRQDQPLLAAKVLSSSIKTNLKRIGVSTGTLGFVLKDIAKEVVDIDQQILYLRRRKESDEVTTIKKAISTTGKMYEVARKIIKPGISELDLFNELQSVAIIECGEPLTYFGNDFRCCEKGGTPRKVRRAAAGELYILDLGPAYRGYFADNARTIAVDDINNSQFNAWGLVSGALKYCESRIKPGANATHLFNEVSELLSESSEGVFDHHLGHGIGLFPHEAPHINPAWNDTFEVGDIIAVEPGLYGTKLKAGIRLENNYLVVEGGVENLSDFPLEL